MATNELAWRRSVERLRVIQRRELPILTNPPRFPPLSRAAAVVSILGLAVATWYVRDRGKPQSRAGLSRRFRQAAERLGPTYIKLAQIISAGEGVFPPELVAECKKCRDQVPPVSFVEIVAVIERELGQPLHRVFRSLDPVPLAAASIAQVHAAVLITGESVVVKVQRPDIDTLVRRDLRVLSWIAPFLVGRIPVSALANPPALVELFAETIVEELDFRLEAANMLDIAEVFVKLERPGFVIPRPHPTHVTKRLLVMERLHGFNFDDVGGMKAAGVDTHAVIETAMIGFLEGAFLHGVFHGDLHSGNLFVLEDGRVGLVDFGITGRLSDEERLAFLRMMMTATVNDLSGQVAALRDLGALPPDTDVDAVIADLGLDGPPPDPTAMAPEELIAELQRIVKALLGYGARMPKPLMLYVKNLIFVDGAIANLAPELDMFSVVTKIATHFATAHGATISAQLGMATKGWDVDVDGIKAGFGVDPSTTSTLTYAELRERRSLIRRRLSGREVD
ncbi:MAG: AarF/ABC1/UbiB kinase family protein [Actinomycetia bacterium]|nr:AarF/ABC1/UbiB kinase family protein [Actinomycetes bacterium]MCP5035254.1 AarF/ABC1/UbiB kinase family protein [Actinomycetes bacterium]